MTVANLKAAATGQATPAEARSPYEAFKRQLEVSKSEFKPLLGSDTNVDRFCRVVLNSVLANGDLIEADRRSLIAACMKAAQDGLMPDGREAVLNIYNTKRKINGRDEWVKMAQYLPMVGGLIKKLYESGEVTYIDAACVYANDKFTYRRGDDPKLEHEPTMTSDPGEIIAAYTVIKLKNGEVKREVMPRRDIDAVRGASKSANNGPWVTWFDQQAIKSVIKRAYKQLPKAEAFEKVAEYDNQAMGFASMGTVGDLIGKSTPALENNASETLQEHFADVPDAVERGASAASGAGAERAAPEGPTYAQLYDRINKAKDKDAAGLAIDASRQLPEDQQRELYDLYERKYPEA